MTTSGLDSDQVRRQYEVVRQDAATDVAFARQGYGVALLMSRGMPAWLKAVSTLCLPSVGPAPAGSGNTKLAPPRSFRDGACAGEPGARPCRGGRFPMSQSTTVTADHLRRLACLYVRQSSLQQVHDHQESTARQYALKRRALALGWAPDRIVVIDDDLGLSGASAVERTGFQRVVADVGLGRVGLVMGLEVSRLARNSSDWHRLLEICALSETLILDEDGLYDPAHFNDRLLLGLKGTMSEAELHVLRARLIGGQLNKARRGELWIRPPLGMVFDPAGKLMLDPDEQVQGAVRLVFDTFLRTGSAGAVVRYFQQQQVAWPRRVVKGPRAGALVFGELARDRVLGILHNPRYAGAYVFGRTRQRKVRPSGQARYRRLPREEWKVFLPDAHPGYITWELFEANQEALRASAQCIGADRRRSAPREGVALLQGLVICGRCGGRMTVRYIVSHGHPEPVYRCQRRGIQRAEPPCQSLPGAAIDRAVSDLVLESVTPASIDVAVRGVRRAAVPGRRGRPRQAGADCPTSGGCGAGAAAVSARAARESARGRQPRTALERGAVRRYGQDPAPTGHCRDEGARGGAGRRLAARLA